MATTVPQSMPDELIGASGNPFTINIMREYGSAVGTTLAATASRDDRNRQAGNKSSDLPFATKEKRAGCPAATSPERIASIALTGWAKRCRRP
jgi:hypothetical protein